MQTQIIVMLSSLVAFAVLGFFLYRSVKNHEVKSTSKKKGRTKYMPQVKNKFN